MHAKPWLDFLVSLWLMSMLRLWKLTMNIDLPKKEKEWMNCLDSLINENFESSHEAHVMKGHLDVIL
jgi:hypothetical protein